MLKSLPQCSMACSVSADLGCSSEYSTEGVDVEDQRGEGFHVNRKGSWVSRHSVTHGQLRVHGSKAPAFVHMVNEYTKKHSVAELLAVKVRCWMRGRCP